MSGRMMRKFRHAGKKAVKFKFSATIEKVVVEGTRSWQPYKLAVVWTRRKRRKSTSSHGWRPGIENPYKGAVEWSKLNPEVLEIEVTLFKDPRRGTYEAKDWVFVLENETQSGKRKAVATARLDMTEHVNEIPSPRPIHIKFKPLTSKLTSANLSLMMRCEFLKEGDAMDPDMASLAGSTTSEDTIRLGSVDVCDFSEFDDCDIDGHSKRSGSINSRGSSTKNQILELTQQIEMFSKGFKEDGDALNQADAPSATSQPPAPNAAENTRPGSRKSSVTGSAGEKTSLASTKSSQDKDEDKTNSKPDDEDALQKSEDIRNSTASESGDGSEPSPVQKRRLRPSLDIVQTRHADYNKQQLTPVNYGSPAAEVHRPLLHWCQIVTEGYRGVKVTNFTTSWRNGLAFCSVLHRLKPDAVAYSELKPLDSRDNLKKAFKGFQDLGFDTEEISKQMRSNSGGIATKAIIISFLTEVKEYAERHNIDDTIEMLKNDKTEEKQKTKQQTRPSLADFMREKLLSDLVEKEGEDDVFSCELDDVLEKETGSDLLHHSHNDELEDTVPDGSYCVTHDESTRLSTISENPYSAKSEDERMNSFLLPDSEKNRNVGGHPEKEVVDSPQQQGFFGPPESKNTIVSSTPAIQEHDKPPAEDAQAEKSQSENLVFHFSPSSMKRASITPPSSPALMDPNIGMIHSEEGMREVVSSLANFNSEVPENKVVPASDRKHSTSPIKVQIFSSEKAIETSNTDVSMSHDNDTHITSSVETVKSARQSNIHAEPVSEKRKKALALIEKFKAEKASEGNDWKTMSLSRDLEGKRREEVRARARKLIEETRASLDIKPSGYSYSSESLDKASNDVFQEEAEEATTIDRYATLPSSKSSWREGGQTQPEQSVKHDVSLPVTAESVQDDASSLFTESRKSSTSFKEVVKEESQIKHVHVVPVSPTKIVSFSEFRKLSEDIEELRTKTESICPDVTAAPVTITSLEETRTSKAKPSVITTDSSDYNGNALPNHDSNHDSRYLIVASNENLDVPPKFHQETTQETSLGNRSDSDKDLTNELTPVISQEESDYSETNPFLSGPPVISDSEQDVVSDLKCSASAVESSYQENNFNLVTPDKVISEKLVEDVEIVAPSPTKSQKIKNVQNVEEEPDASSSVLSEKTEDRERIPEADAKSPVQNVGVRSPAREETPRETEYSSDPLGVLTPQRIEGAEMKSMLEIDAPITSTPLAAMATVKYRNPRIQPKTNGEARSPGASASSQSDSPIRVTAVKPVKMSDLETFSPILNTPTKGPSRADLPRSRPTSIKLRHRKSSTSSIRKSIAANDTSHLEKEKLALEEEMRVVDDRSDEVKEEMEQLKNAGGRGRSKQREEILMQEWFQLVQKKNAIVRQQDQLLLLEQEHDLEQQMNEINEQLRPLMAIEESQKTVAQKETEKGLLDQLVCLVNERDRIIRTVDENEQSALDDDMHVQTNLDQNMSNVFAAKDEKCALM